MDAQSAGDRDLKIDLGKFADTRRFIRGFRFVFRVATWKEQGPEAGGPAGEASNEIQADSTVFGPR